MLQGNAWGWTCCKCVRAQADRHNFTMDLSLRIITANNGPEERWRDNGGLKQTDNKDRGRIKSVWQTFTERHVPLNIPRVETAPVRTGSEKRQAERGFNHRDYLSISFWFSAGWGFMFNLHPPTLPHSRHLSLFLFSCLTATLLMINKWGGLWWYGWMDGWNVERGT